MNNLEKRILVTGFEPFDNDLENPSAHLLNWLNSIPTPLAAPLKSIVENSFNQSLKASINIETQLLPVSFTKAYPLLLNKINAYQPTHCVLTGFAKKNTTLALERIAINWVDARIPDNEGLILKNQKINESGPDGIFTNISIEQMLESTNKVQCPTYVSTSAGEYVCNYLIYSYLADNKTIPGTFIHIPSATDYTIFYQGIYSILLNLN
jgi:pyroglutamyl-peptidase